MIHGIPALPKDTILLKVDPPGTAFCGWSFLKRMSNTVSPMPITRFFMIQEFGAKVLLFSDVNKFFCIFYQNICIFKKKVVILQAERKIM
jgi:hypothetical protein